MTRNLNIAINIAFLVLISTRCAHGQDLRPKLDSYVSAFAEQEKFSGSVLVAKDHEILLSKGYGMANYELDVPNTPRTKFRLASITKQFTAMAIMQLQEMGLLSVEDKLSKFVPEYSNGEGITIHHLLTHTSGIPNVTSFKNFGEEKIKPHTLEQLIELFKDRPLDFQPGERYQYSNSGYILLSHIIEKVSGKPYEEFLTYTIFNPLSMVDSGYDKNGLVVKNRASGYKFIDDVLVNSDYIDMSYVVGAGALYSSILDLYKWNQALYSEKLLPTKSLETIFTPHQSMENDKDPNSAAYGYGWIIHKINHRNVVDQECC